jgi:tetratricopeptide (TPR) repeat protein
MDPFSIAIGTVQIAGACSAAMTMIIKWGIDIRTAEERISGFFNEIHSLSTTYTDLKEVLESKLLKEEVRNATKTHEGRHLWAQIKTALDDSIQTVERINEILKGIDKSSGLFKKTRTQLAESLHKGELANLRERIRFFNANISLPIQMIGVLLQLQQRDLDRTRQQTLDRRFNILEHNMKQLTVNLQYRNEVTKQGESLIMGSLDDRFADHARGKENYLAFTRRILNTVSVAATSARSTTMSTLSATGDTAPQIDLNDARLSTGISGEIYQQQRERSIPDWISASQSTIFSEQYPIVSVSVNASPSPRPDDAQQRPSAVDELNYRKLRSFLAHGHNKAEADSHDSAEQNFKRALQLLVSWDFSDRISFHPADVVLQLANSCLKQQKYDDAITYLTPVAEEDPNVFPQFATDATRTAPLPARYAPDKLQSLAASHMLGEVCRQKGQFDEAKTHASRAFEERMVRLGDHNEKTLESVHLLIAIHTEMGDEVEAEMYGDFLKPQTSRKADRWHDEVDEKPTAFPLDQVVSPRLTEPVGLEKSYTQTQTQTQTPAKQKVWRKMLPTRNSNGNPGDVRTKTDERTGSGSFSRSATLTEIPPDVSMASTTHPSSRVAHPDTPPQQFAASQLTSPTSESASRRLSSRADSWTSHGDNPPILPSDEREALERTPAVTQLLPEFQAVLSLWNQGKANTAAKIGLKFLKKYPSRVYIVRTDELRRNITSGSSSAKGLAATGEGYAAIHYFCELDEEKYAEVAILVSMGVDINAGCYRPAFTSGECLTPLGLATKKGHTEIAKLLLRQRGIKVDVRDGDSLVPLLVACRKRNYELVRAFMEVPGSVPENYPVIWHGSTVLHDAARHCDLVLVNIFLEHRPEDIDEQDKFGKTPLMYAVIKSDVNDPDLKRRLCRSRLQVCLRLVEAGADITIVDESGKTASAYAELEGDNELRNAVSQKRFELSGSSETVLEM